MLHNSLWTRPTLNRLQSQNLRTLLIITTATSTTTTISIILTITTRALREFIIPLKKVKHLLSPYFRSLSPLPLFLHNFLSSSFGKKERILPCLIASCSELESTAASLPVHPYPPSLPSFHLPSPFCPFPMCYRNLAGICDREGTSSVPCKSRH